MVDLHDTNLFSFAFEATEGVDPLTLSTDPTYYFGEYQNVFDYPLEEVNEMLQHYNSLDPSVRFDGNSKVETVPVFAPVNGLMDYITLCGVGGSGVSHNAGVFTLTPSASQGTKLNSLITRMDSGNSAENIREHYVGNKVQSKIESIDFETGLPLQTVLQLDAHRRVDPAYAAAHTPIFPSSKRDMYYKDANTVFTWNGVDLMPYAINFTWTEYNLNTIFTPDQQSYPKNIRRGNRLILYGFDMYRASGTGVWDDAKARTARTLVFKIYNDYTNDLYRQNTFNNCVSMVKMNKVLTDQKQKPVYRVTGSALSVSPINKDGLATSFYGV